MKIALSKTTGSPKYIHYFEWLRSVDPTIELIEMDNYPEIEQCISILNECSGIVFTGGADVNPERYGQGSRLSECHIDQQRDEREFAMAQHALEQKLPILGICRGAQLLNIAAGGTLFIDIPTDVYTDTEHRSIGQEGNRQDSYHDVETQPGSLLRKITRQDKGIINSAHHQSVKELSAQFKPAAISSDGIIEAFEWADSEGKAFLLAVQWHPERMDFGNPFSLRIASHFLYEAEAYTLLIRK
jgi:putative glutamine amidotransferase